MLLYVCLSLYLSLFLFVCLAVRVAHSFALCVIYLLNNFFACRARASFGFATNG